KAPESKLQSDSMHTEKLAIYITGAFKDQRSQRGHREVRCLLSDGGYMDMTSETQYVAMEELSPAHIQPAECEELCTPAGTHTVIQVHPR
ncbi:hypothetical protein KUCAC02_037594, partial [Chaenocephalus aceratus]